MARFNRTLDNKKKDEQNQLQEIPLLGREPTMRLEDLVGDKEIAAIKKEEQICFHALGDTGVGTIHQDEVIEAMARDIKVKHPEKGAIFLLHLGDIIYGPNKSSWYANRFYRPNLSYLQPAPGFDGIILAVPGNHDGEVRDKDDAPTLNAFIENFCAEPGSNPPTADSFGVVMPNQPEVYWHLVAPFVDVIGLYSNAADDFGTLLGKHGDTRQIDWLRETLKTIQHHRKADKRKALIFATHHSPYGWGLKDKGHGHSGSPEMLAQLDEVCAAADVWPDAVLSGHSHSYQRYVRHCTHQDGRDFHMVCLIAGTGGASSSKEPEGIGNIIEEPLTTNALKRSGVIYASGLESYGYLRVRATKHHLYLTFVRADGTHRDDFETVTIELATQKLLFA
jgi:Calcineurin-like phosphoesterase